MKCTLENQHFASDYNQSFIAVPDKTDIHISFVPYGSLKVSRCKPSGGFTPEGLHLKKWKPSGGFTSFLEIFSLIVGGLHLFVV